MSEEKLPPIHPGEILRDEFLVPLLEGLERSTPRKDLYLIAAAMNHDELHPEVTEKLDRIADALNVAPAAPTAR